jgi:hypothetical protein
MRIRAVAAALALASLPLGTAAALEPPDTLRVNWGVLVESLLNPAFSDPTLTSSVSTPSINFNFGAGVSMPFSPGSRFSFGPSADFYYYNGEFIEGQPVAADQGFSSTFVFGALLNAPIVYSIPISPQITISAGVGLCIDLRFAFPSGDLNPTASAQASNAYFWGKGRFITPSTTLRFEYALTERVGFGFSGRVLWPIYNLWTGEGYGFFDQGKYLIDLVVRFRLKPAGGSAAAAPAAAPTAAANPAAAS